ncbi:three-helix bundle dimerization domain-containing protein [Rhodococcus maanshanensis]|uniref:Uncharacterized protein n=1 Tax=Rhodococcus maanshanensis TaxID=183556 RepID=A0A1H7YPF7_9NOCA|nr:hypothetical protein [Rhodococcus maanshanensis]SEM47724.1 hypothetical protein SAMN05444583_14310 [Rhodococcus maanshanensis]
MNPDLPPSDEHRHLEFVSDRLRQKHPDVTGEVICETVDRVHHRFDGRGVRDFVPVLVERRAAEELVRPNQIHQVPG